MTKRIESPEIVIKMNDVNEAPQIWINGKKQEGIISVDFKFRTKDAAIDSGEQYYNVEYFDKNTQTVRREGASRI